MHDKEELTECPDASALRLLSAPRHVSLETPRDRGFTRDDRDVCFVCPAMSRPLVEC